MHSSSLIWGLWAIGSILLTIFWFFKIKDKINQHLPPLIYTCNFKEKVGVVTKKDYDDALNSRKIHSIPLKIDNIFVFYQYSKEYLTVLFSCSSESRSFYVPDTAPINYEESSALLEEAWRHIHNKPYKSEVHV